MAMRERGMCKLVEFRTMRRARRASRSHLALRCARACCAHAALFQCERDERARAKPKATRSSGEDAKTPSDTASLLTTRCPDPMANCGGK
eukprot:4321909-Prymnesium_polylepis.1